MDFDIKIKGKIYNIRIFEKGSDKVSVKVGERSFDFDKVKKETGKNKNVSEFAKQQKVQLKKELKAAIAGEVSEVYVKDGDNIKAGQKILTLLAMKMENEIFSETDGKIKKVLIRPNKTVREGEILVIFE
ncbi:MAG: biotin/lipoyl-containing protein [Candidatus Paceibacterota bacterium]